MAQWVRRWPQMHLEPNLSPWDPRKARHSRTDQMCVITMQEGRRSPGPLDAVRPAGLADTGEQRDPVSNEAEDED